MLRLSFLSLFLGFFITPFTFASTENFLKCESSSPDLSFLFSEIVTSSSKQISIKLVQNRANLVAESFNLNRIEKSRGWFRWVNRRHYRKYIEKAVHGDLLDRKSIILWGSNEDVESTERKIVILFNYRYKGNITAFINNEIFVLKSCSSVF